MTSLSIGNDTSVKVAVRIRPLNADEQAEDSQQQCIKSIPGVPQIIAGSDTMFTFDYVFGTESSQASIYDDCVVPLVNGILKYYSNPFTIKTNFLLAVIFLYPSCIRRI